MCITNKPIIIYTQKPVHFIEQTIAIHHTIYRAQLIYIHDSYAVDNKRWFFFLLVTTSKFHGSHHDDGDSCILSQKYCNVKNNSTLRRTRFTLRKIKQNTRNFISFLSHYCAAIYRELNGMLFVLVFLSSGLRNIFVCLFFIHVLRRSCFLPRFYARLWVY